MDEMKPVVELFSTEMRTAVDNGIMKAVYDVGVTVDKERLLQALKDARAFWHEGYEAGCKGKPRWISVEERLPEEALVGKCILVCIKNRWNEQRVDAVHWWGPERMHGAAWFWSDVTHWMPLPEPPTEGE